MEAGVDELDRMVGGRAFTQAVPGPQGVKP